MINEIDTLMNLGYSLDEAQNILKSLYESKIDNLKKEINDKLMGFSVIVKYDRGLGTEFINLQPVFATSLKDAKETASLQVDNYFKGTKWEVKQVNLRPEATI